MRYVYKGFTDLARYDLKFNANSGHVLYTTRKYIAFVSWTEEGYSILDFGDETDKEVWNRLYRNHKPPTKIAILANNFLEMLVTLNMAKGYL